MEMESLEPEGRWWHPPPGPPREPSLPGLTSSEDAFFVESGLPDPQKSECQGCESRFSPTWPSSSDSSM